MMETNLPVLKNPMIAWILNLLLKILLLSLLRQFQPHNQMCPNLNMFQSSMIIQGQPFTRWFRVNHRRALGTLNGEISWRNASTETILRILMLSKHFNSLVLKVIL